MFWMIGRVRNLLIGDCGRRVDNLVPKDIEETQPNFYWLQKKKSLILIELLCPCSLFWIQILGLLQEESLGLQEGAQNNISSFSYIPILYNDLCI